MALLVLPTGLLGPHELQAKHASLRLGDSVTGGASISGAQSHEYDIDDPQPNQYKGRAFTCCVPSSLPHTFVLPNEQEELWEQ